MTTTSTRTSKPTIGAGRTTERRRNDERDLFARSRGLIRIALVVALWAVALTPRWSFSAPGGLREPSPSPTDLVMGGGFSPSRPEAPGGRAPPCQHKCEDHPDIESDTDPIDIHRGEFVETRPDVFIPNRGFDLAVAFTYRSRSAINSHWGYGWDMNYNRRLRPLSNGDMYVLMGSGQRHEFTFDGGNSWSPPAGHYSTLVSNPDGTYLHTHANGEKEHYDVDGNLTSIVDFHGNTITFTYDPAGLLPITGPSDYFVNQTVGVIAREYRLTRISDQAGRHVDLSYDASGRLGSITWEGRTVSYTYSAAGDLETVTTPATAQFPNGTTTRYSYTRHNLETITDPLGQIYLVNHYDHDADRVLSQTFGGHTTTIVSGQDAQGNVTADVTDRKGYLSRYTFDTEGHITRLEKFTDGVPANEPSSYITTYEYDEGGNLVRQVSPGGNAVEYVYADHGDVVEVRTKAVDIPARTNDPSDIVTSYTYEPQFQLPKTITDTLGRTTTLVYDYELGEPARGNVRRVILPRTHKGTPIYEMTFDAWGLVTSVTDPVGTVATFVYDPNTGELTSAMTAKGTTEEATIFAAYDRVGNLHTITDALGHVTTYERDARGLLTRTISPAPASLETRYRYDANDNVVQIDTQERATPGPLPPLRSHSASDGWRSVHAAYDILDRVTSIRDELGRVADVTYDANGNRETLRDANGLLTQHEYDERDLPWRVTDPAGGVVESLFDKNGNIVSLRDQNGNATTYLYDDYARLERTTFADGSFAQFGYDAASNLKTRVTTAGDSFSYVYDELNRLVSKIAPSETTTYDYDLASRLLRIADSDATIEYVHDAASRVRTVTTALTAGPTYSVGYKYDINGNRISAVHPGGREVGYVFDELRRLTSVTTSGTVTAPSRRGGVSTVPDAPRPPPTELASFRYDTLGRLTDYFRANGMVTSYGYDRANRVTDIATTGPNGPIDAIHYVLDTYGNRKQRTDGFGLHEYATDDLHQITTVDFPNVFPFEDKTFDFDAVGNRTTVTGATSGPKNYIPNTLNQITSIDTTALVWDPNGNLVHDGNQAYVHDEENRLTSVTTPSGSVSYTYDPFGRRISKTVGSTTTWFVHDGVDVIQDLDASGRVLRSYVHANSSGAPIAMFTDTGERYFHVEDGVASTTHLVDDAGRVKESYAYDLYGRPAIFDDQGMQITSSAVGNRHLFGGGEWDEETGLVYCLFRYLHPGLGRFIERDPLGYGPDINLYRYVSNNPALWIDPFGLSKGVGQPGFAESWIPVWGPGRAALDNFQNGNYGRAALDTAFLALDLVGVGVVAKAAFRGVRRAAAVVGGTTIAWWFQSVVRVVRRTCNKVIEKVVQFPRHFAEFWYRSVRSHDDYVDIYRAVKPDELRDIKKYREFINRGSAEGKYFTSSAQAASDYARQAVRQFGDPPYTTVRTRIHKSRLSEPVSVDGGIPAYVVPDHVLPDLVPEILRYMTLP